MFTACCCVYSEWKVVVKDESFSVLMQPIQIEDRFIRTCLYVVENLLGEEGERMVGTMIVCKDKNNM